MSKGELAAAWGRDYLWDDGGAINLSLYGFSSGQADRIQVHQLLTLVSMHETSSHLVEIPPEYVTLGPLERSPMLTESSGDILVYQARTQRADRPNHRAGSQALLPCPPERDAIRYSDPDISRVARPKEFI